MDADEIRRFNVRHARKRNGRLLKWDDPEMKELPPKLPDQNLLEPQPRDPSRPFRQSELRQLALELAESGLNSAQFAKLYDLPPYRVQKAAAAFGGLIKKRRAELKKKGK